MLLPSILAAEAGGQGRFELEADKVGDALRALPVANMLFDERGNLFATEVMDGKLGIALAG